MFKKLLYFVFVSLIITTSCDDPREDFNLHFAPKMYKYAMALRIHDFADPDELYTGDVTIEISGPDASKIYSADGTRNYEANFGRVLVITDAAGQPTASDPLEFSIKVISTEYEDKTINYIVPEGQTYVALDAYLINESNPPQSLVTSATTAALNANGELTQPLEFTTNAAGSAEPLTINIPTGIQFLDVNGNTLNGSDLNVKVRSYDASQEGINRAMSNQGLTVDEVNGEPVISFIRPDVNFSIKMSVGGTEVKSFTGAGVELKMPVADDMFNSAQNRVYQAGDAIRVKSFSDGDIDWQEEGTYTVVEENGKFWAKPSISHLSEFTPIDFPAGVRNFTLVDNISNRPLVLSAQLKVRGTRYTLRFSDMVAMSASIGNELTWEGNQLVLPFGLSSAVILELNNTPKQYIADVNGLTITFNPPPSSVDVGYSVRCQDSEVTYQPLYGSVVSYRESGTSNSYKELYTFTAENAANQLHTFQGLENGKMYDFKMNWLFSELDQTSLTIEDGKIYELELTPSECSKIGF